jgi:uncharacterized tellurite resistance protein B-like protein
MKRLTREDRLRLMKFLCSVAWSDLEITDAERESLARFVQRFGLHADEEELVNGWLESPPPAEEVDPALVPPEHRELLLSAARELVAADGVVQPEEVESIQLLEQLLG